MHRPTLALAPLLTLGLVAAACGDDGADTAPPTTDEVADFELSETTTTSTTVAPGPPTTRGLPEPVVVEPLPADLGSRSVLSGEPPYTGVLGQVSDERVVVAPVALPPAPVDPGVAPLTGLPLADATAADRPAIVVKVDNTSRGRPQEALTQADLVYEEMIEGGVTRLAAVFHTNAPELGPVRSGRTTDIALLGSLGRPIFAWSGANKVHAALLRERNIVDLGHQNRSEYYRADDRPGTYDLMVQATALHEVAAGLGETGTPPPHFEYRDEMVTLPPTAVPARGVTVTFPMAEASWSWNGEGWARTQNGTEHVDADGMPIVATNVIVAEVPDVSTGSIDTAGSAVREQVFLGSGNAWVFTDGHLVQAQWTKPSIDSVPTYTTPDGIPVALVPGVTWVELVPPGGVDVSSPG